MDEIRLGGLVVPQHEALAYATSYLTQRGHGWAYPWYDGFDVQHAAGPLVDADLLAPLLLNVRISITTYAALQAVRPRLQSALDSISPELSLADATPEQVAGLGELFAVLDDPGVPGARGTVLSTMLHRKRPALIPLYDEQVRSVYQDGPDAPVPPATEPRPWREFWGLYSLAVQADLKRELPFWQRLAALAPGPPITPLRALDIVAWWAGRPDLATSGTPATAPE